jgi:hypothetical protein
MKNILESMDEREPEDVPGVTVDTISENSSDIEPVTMSETLTNCDDGPIIFCGMGRINVQNETWDSDKSNHKNKPHKPFGVRSGGPT